MIKKKLTLSIDDELISFAKAEDLNISDFLEGKLAEHFNLEASKSCWRKK